VPRCPSCHRERDPFDHWCPVHNAQRPPRRCGFGGLPGDPAPCRATTRHGHFLCDRHSVVIGRLGRGRSQGRPIPGATPSDEPIPGRWGSVPPEVAARVMARHREGVAAARIARQLTDEGVPTARGAAAWHPSTASKLIRRAEKATAGSNSYPFVLAVQAGG
jgi:hypothetical protein